MRVFCGGFAHESNTFCPTLTTLAAFEARQHLRGAGLREAFRDAHHELGGFLAAMDERGVEVAAGPYASAGPAGPVPAAAYETIVADLLDELANARAEGVYLALHGAMASTRHGDAEGELLARVRALIGPAVPLVASLDWHANVSRRMVAASDALVVYQTYPHLDQRQRGAVAADLLARAVAGEVRLVQALADPPLILHLKAQETGVEPMRSVLAAACEVATRPGILDVSVAGGFPYADIPEMGTTAVVVADGDQALATRAARELGERLWAIREAGLVDLPDAAAAVRLALEPGPTPVVLVDFGDNVGGGSAADGPLLLRELLAQGAAGYVVTFHAPELVRQCVAAGVGAPVAFAAGGTCADGQGPPVNVTGVVRGVFDGRYTEPEPRHGGAFYHDQGLTAVVETPGPGKLVLTTVRASPNSLWQLRCLGIEPERERILVVKAAIAYKAAYEGLAGRIIEVDTPGYTALDPRRFEFRNRRRPLVPFELDAVYGPAAP